MRLLLVEDDTVLGDVVAEALGDHGYVVDWVENGEDGLVRAQQEDYSIVLLDVNLPGIDGVRLCKRMRSLGFTLPILVLTARDASSDKVMGLDAGADDYIVKPVDLPELLARLRAVLRRNRGTANASLCWGDIQLDPSTRVVAYRENIVTLTPKEFALLELFLHNQQRVLSRQVIISQLWKLEETPTEESVKSHIKSLRSKLIKAGADYDPIETVWGVGYRLRQFPSSEDAV